MSVEDRAKLQNVYLRPWTLLRSAATECVLYLADLELYAAGAKSHRRAWRQYVRGQIVSDYPARIIKNFLLAVMAEGKDDNKEQEVTPDDEPEERLSNILTLDRIHALISAQAADSDGQEDSSVSAISKKLQNAMQRAARTLGKHSGNVTQQPAHRYCRRLSKDARNKESLIPGQADKTASAQLYSSNYEDLHAM